MTKLIIIQPIIASYRLDFFNELARHFNDVIVFSDCMSNQGFSENIDGLFKFVRTKTYGSRTSIYYQNKIYSFLTMLNNETHKQKYPQLPSPKLILHDDTPAWNDKFSTKLLTALDYQYDSTSNLI